MNAVSLSCFQSQLKAVSADTGWQLESNGVEYSANFYHTVSRSRDRFLLYAGGIEIGIMDSVIPFSIFKPAYEVFTLHFSTVKPFPFPGIEWEEDPYQDETEPARYFPHTRDPEVMAAFHQAYFGK